VKDKFEVFCVHFYLITCWLKMLQCYVECNFSDRCEAAPVLGPCKHSTYKWYYNSSLGQCLTFVYGGCNFSDADNKFNSEHECLHYCGGAGCKYDASTCRIKRVGHVACIREIRKDAKILVRSQK
jgi:hypothetical protein